MRALAGKERFGLGVQAPLTCSAIVPVTLTLEAMPVISAATAISIRSVVVLV